MGQGFIYECKDCKLNIMVPLGVGMMFPREYQEVLQAAKDGEYGKEWQALATKSDYIAIDAYRKFYLCPSCGHWKVDHDLSLYEPFDENEIKNKKYEKWTGKESEISPYVDGHDLSNDYLELRHFIHKCDKCDAVMLEAESEQFDEIPGIGLKCPECGSFNEVTDTICWD